MFQCISLNAVIVLLSQHCCAGVTFKKVIMQQVFGVVWYRAGRKLVYQCGQSDDDFYGSWWVFHIIHHSLQYRVSLVTAFTDIVNFDCGHRQVSIELLLPGLSSQDCHGVECCAEISIIYSPNMQFLDNNCHFYQTINSRQE